MHHRCSLGRHTPSVIADSAATAQKKRTVVTLSVRLAPVTLAVNASAAPAAALSPAPTTASLPETMDYARSA